MENNDFIEKLRSKEIARRDQREADVRAQQNQSEVNANIQANARSAFEELEEIARNLTSNANSRLEHRRFEMFPAAGGFCIKVDRYTAGFSYAPPLIANMGSISMNVYLQEQVSNFVALGIADGPYPEPPRHLRFEPAWDTDAAAIVWTRDRNKYLTNTELVQRVMEELIHMASA